MVPEPNPTICKTAGDNHTSDRQLVGERHFDNRWFELRIERIHSTVRNFVGLEKVGKGKE